MKNNIIYEKLTYSRITYFDWEKWDILPLIPQNLLVGSAIKDIAHLSDGYPLLWPSLKSIRQIL